MLLENLKKKCTIKGGARGRGNVISSQLCLNSHLLCCVRACVRACVRLMDDFIFNLGLPVVRVLPTEYSTLHLSHRTAFMVRWCWVRLSGVG